MVSTGKDDQAASDVIRTVSRHSLAYMLCAASEKFCHYDFDPLDLLIIHAVLNANVLNVMKNPELDRRFGSIHAVEPDEIKQGVSRAALSRFLALPIETVRRRADRLKKDGILRDTDQGQRMMASLLVLNETQVHFLIENRTTGQIFPPFNMDAPTDTWSGIQLKVSGATAEWIVERPTDATTGDLYELPDYNEVLSAAKLIDMYVVKQNPERTAKISIAKPLDTTEFLTHFR